jgi:hypothetical protein
MDVRKTVVGNTIFSTLNSLVRDEEELLDSDNCSFWN